MAKRNYWSSILERRISRRRALSTSGAAAFSAGLLMACGSDGEHTPAGTGLLTFPADTTSQAKRGGIMKDRALQDPAGLDPFTANLPWDGVGPHMYSSLVQFKPGYLKRPDNEVIGDIADSWEWSPDGLQITLKLRQGVKFHNKVPVSGRLLDMEDVLFSWNRFATKSGGRVGVINSLNPSAPIVSLTATDSRTIVVKLSEPVVYALGLLVNASSGFMLILPKETDSTFDIRGDMIGTGPYTMANYTPSSSFTLKRNPEYYDKDWALVDQIEKPIISEYSTVLAHFKSGNLYTFGSHRSMQINLNDVLDTKREQPAILVYPGDLRIGVGGSAGTLAFGWMPEGRSPLLDERVRQALSMSLDRDLYVEVFNNVSAFEAEGLPIETYWNTALGAATEGWWLDPKGKDFGANARYFHLNVPEAKKLLSAAGYGNGFEVTSHQVTGGQLGEAYLKSAEVLEGMIQNLGISTQVSSIDYTKEYIPTYRDGKGQWNGWAFITSGGGITGGHAIGALANQYWAKGAASSFHGFSLNGKNDQAGDPALDLMIEKGRLERDTEKLRTIVFDVQRHLAKTWYSLPPLGIGSTFSVAWPCVRNFRVYEQTGNTWQNYRTWIDETKPPFTRT